MIKNPRYVLMFWDLTARKAPAKTSANSRLKEVASCSKRTKPDSSAGASNPREILAPLELLYPSP